MRLLKWIKKRTPMMKFPQQIWKEGTLNKKLRCNSNFDSSITDGHWDWLSKLKILENARQCRHKKKYLFKFPVPSFSSSFLSHKPHPELSMKTTTDRKRSSVKLINTDWSVGRSVGRSVHSNYNLLQTHKQRSKSWTKIEWNQEVVFRKIDWKKKINCSMNVLQM